MRLASYLSTLLLWTCAASLFAQAPVITNVEPATGPVTGGTTLTITGQNLRSPNPASGAYVPPVLYVGGRKADLISVTDTTITAVTAPYTNGRFDVTFFRENDTLIASKKNAFAYGNNWERVLLPVYLTKDLPGAAGSLWRTELAGFAGFQAYVTTNPGGQPCISCPNNVTGTFRASDLVASDMHVPGRLVWVGSYDPARLIFNLRVRDVSRETENLGTEIRTVREDEAYGPRSAIALPGVPLGPLYRAKLRVYQVDAAEGRTVSVAFYRADAAYLPAIAMRDLTLTREPDSVYPGYPGYAELDLETIPELSAYSRIVIVVRTPDEGEYWALVSVTNNQTQQITTVTP